MKQITFLLYLYVHMVIKVLEIGSLIEGKYKILNKIGQGGMSVVYLAMNEKANKQWAIKEVRKDGIRDFQLVKQGLIAETNLLKKLRHPNLPSIIDIIDDNDTFLIVMDYIQGNPLSRKLEEYKALPQEFVIECAKQLCDVLAYLDSCDPPIIYRDMKPSNIMLKPDGSITLIDFGTAREYKADSIADTTCLGTIGYAAPEQFGGQGQTDRRTDIYSLGATLYHLVTGHNPCEPPYEILPIRQINPSLSAGLEKILIKCTQKNPDDRYQSYAELMYALTHYNQIDESYRGKQIRRLGVFLSTFILAVLFILLAFVGYSAAEDKKSENYDIKLILARDGNNTKQESIDQYMDAILVDQTDTRAYLELIDLFLSSENQSGNFSRDEANVLTQLQAGINSNNKNDARIIYPFEILKNNNRAGYTQVCFEIGMAYWYDYEIELDRQTFALEWLKETVDDNAIAKSYCDIGELQVQLKKYSRQNRIEKIHEIYNSLWNELVLLHEEALKTDDNDIKFMIYTEVTSIINEKAAYFAVKTPLNEMLALLDDIYTEAFDLKEDTKYEEFKASIIDLLNKIDETKLRIKTIE